MQDDIYDEYAPILWKSSQEVFKLTMVQLKNPNAISQSLHSFQVHFIQFRLHIKYIVTVIKNEVKSWILVNGTKINKVLKDDVKL